MITAVSAGESYQTLQEPGRPGDNDENLLDQFGDDRHLLTLWTLIRLIRKGQKDDGLLLWVNPIGTSHEAARLFHRGCLHFVLAHIIFSIHFIFLHCLLVIQ